MNQPYTLQSLFHSFEDRVDPYYEIDAMGSHKRLGRPHFNVSETETAFLLDGEVPGVADKNQITVEWLQNQVLIIRGIIKPADTETMKDPFQEGLRNELSAPLGMLPMLCALISRRAATNIFIEHEEPPKTLEKLSLEVMIDKPKPKLPRRLLHERHIGEFMRSFTFPMEVDSDGMKANLSDGLLRIVVPKKADKVVESKRIDITNN